MGRRVAYGGAGDDALIGGASIPFGYTALGGTDVIARGDGSADRAKAVGQAVGLREPE